MGWEIKLQRFAVDRKSSDAENYKSLEETNFTIKLSMIQHQPPWPVAIGKRLLTFTLNETAMSAVKCLSFRHIPSVEFSIHADNKLLEH